MRRALARTFGPLALGSALATQHRRMGENRNSSQLRYKPAGVAKAAMGYEMNKEMSELCNNLAKVAHNARNYADAIGLYDRVLDWRRKADGPVHEKTAATLHNIGRVFMDMKKYAAAENCFTEECAIYDELHKEKKDMRYAEGLSMLAVTYTHLKFLPEAAKAFDEALEVAKTLCYDKHRSSWLPVDTTTPPPNPQEHPLSGVAHCLADQAKLLITLHQEENALRNLSDALAIRRYLYTTNPKFRPIIAQTLGKISEVKRVMRDATGAQDTVDEAIDISIDTLGRESPQTAQLISMKGMLFCAMTKFQEASKLFEESATTFAVAFGKKSSAYGDELVKLARCHESLRHNIQAEKLFTEGIAVLEEAAGEKHLATVEAKAYFANFLMQQSELTRAVDLLQKVIAVRKELNDQDPILAGHYHRLGLAMNRMTDAQAEVYYLLAIEKFRLNAAKDENHLIYATDVLDDLGLFYCEYKHFDKAEKALQESLDIRRKILGEKEGPHHAYCFSNFALMYMYQQKFEDCEKYAVKALALYKAMENPETRAMADLQTTMGMNYFNQTRYNEAILYLDKSLNIRRKKGDDILIGTVENLVQLSHVYVKQKKWQKAKDYVDEAKLLGKKSPRMMEALLKELDRIEKEIPPKELWASELLDANLLKPVQDVASVSMESISRNWK